MISRVCIAAFYVFLPLEEEELASLREELMAFGRIYAMRGLVLLAPEGINGTVCGTAEAIARWKERIVWLTGAIDFKDSEAGQEIFRRWSVKIKKEIVGLRQSGIRPQGKHRHVSPQEWQKILEKEDVVLLDARNDYEVGIGKFRGAQNLGIHSFHEFPAYARTAGIAKDKKILMYCTGGIRCEKALLVLEQEGYQDVHQLDGGILAYLQKFPHGNFEGECFVFDERVAVDQELRPSQVFSLCPHCGDPACAQTACGICGARKAVCDACLQEKTRQVCSKQCAKKFSSEENNTRASSVGKTLLQPF